VLADIARQTVQQVADRAQWRFTTVDHQGELIAEGLLRYRPTAAQTRFVQARDQTCVAPGCRMPAVRCDLDHIVDRAKAGPTTIANLAALCRRHHRAKHKGKHRIRRGPNGIEWITPRGRRYLLVPRDALAPSELELTLHRLAHAENIMSLVRR
jgi:5-methylcytosine-specific restriction endonuclease McrA